MALMDRRLKDPFAVRFKTDAAKREFTEWICDVIDAELTARSSIIGPNGDFEYNHWLYRQGRTPERQRRFPGAADLSSSLVYEKVSALRARIVQTIFTEPVWTVEGWGQDAKKAPFAEEFHQWKLEEERLQQYLSKVVHNGLIEQNGILEVLDRSDVRLVTKLQRFAAKLAQDGTALLAEDDTTPLHETDDAGRPVLATDPKQPYVEAQTSTYQTQRKGPGYRVISQRNFLFLPGHAADKAELFGYAKRCWVRWSQLQERVKLGIYDKDALDSLVSISDRTDLQPGLAQQGQTLADQRDNLAEKELWEVMVLYDCDGDGIEEWYLCTVSVVDRALLRIRKDDLGVPRFIDFTLFPQADSVYGYSFVGDVLASTAEEDTAMRNMTADRSMLATNPPIKVLKTAAYNPQTTPWGTGQILRVLRMDEVEPMVIPDVPPSAMALRAVPRQTADAVTGLNDVAAGVTPEERRTATENSLLAQASAVRVNEVVKNMQESLETLFLVRNEFWIRTLESQQDGMEPPQGIVRSIETRGLELANGKFTADMLRGNLRGKPRGSVETADKARQRQDFGQSLQGLAMLAKMFPMIAVIFQNPDAAEAVIDQWARLFNVPDRQVFTDSLRKARQAMAAAQGGGMPMAPGPLPPEGGGDLSALLRAMPPDLQQLLMSSGAGADAGGVQ